MNHLSPLLVQSSGICAERGEGSWLFDGEGRRWLDFTSGIGVTATGHCHHPAANSPQARHPDPPPAPKKSSNQRSASC